MRLTIAFRSKQKRVQLLNRRADLRRPDGLPWFVLIGCGFMTPRVRIAAANLARQPELCGRLGDEVDQAAW
jgi:hypothetical protein